VRLLPAHRDGRALLVGGAVLLLVTATYPEYAHIAARPLAVFVLPGLFTAVLGGWRPTATVGVLSFVVAVAVGLSGALTAQALVARWGIILVVLVLGTVAAALRERQEARVAELDRTLLLREAFELGLAPAPRPPAGFVAVARYRPAESRLLLGGDFLEAIALPDGRLAVLIGDVCGHGPREAAFGAALRAGWLGIVRSSRQDPAGWVESLGASFFHDERIDTFVTLCTGYLDRATGTARFVNCGHPPPVRLSGRPEPLDLPPGPPLGLGFALPRTSTEVAWGGEPLLFYTDGLVENPALAGPPRRWEEDGLLDWLRRPSAVTSRDPDELADAVVAAATAGRDLRDDIAVLLVASRPVGAAVAGISTRGTPGAAGRG
jgi:hypothetical protein